MKSCSIPARVLLSIPVIASVAQADLESEIRKIAGDH